jgi:hypothetical protein
VARRGVAVREAESTRADRAKARESSRAPIGRPSRPPALAIGPSGRGQRPTNLTRDAAAGSSPPPVLAGFSVTPPAAPGTLPHRKKRAPRAREAHLSEAHSGRRVRCAPAPMILRTPASSGCPRVVRGRLAARAPSGIRRVREIMEEATTAKAGQQPTPFSIADILSRREEARELGERKRGGSRATAGLEDYRGQYPGLPSPELSIVKELELLRRNLAQASLAGFPGLPGVEQPSFKAVGEFGFERAAKEASLRQQEVALDMSKSKYLGERRLAAYCAPQLCDFPSGIFLNRRSDARGRRSGSTLF